MFRFTRKPSSGSYGQYIAKITRLVQSGYVEFVRDVISVMARVVFRPRQTRQLPRAVDLKGRLLSCQSY